MAETAGHWYYTALRVSNYFMLCKNWTVEVITINWRKAQSSWLPYQVGRRIGCEPETCLMHVFSLSTQTLLKGTTSTYARCRGKGMIPATVAHISIYTSLLDAVKIIVLSGWKSMETACYLLDPRASVLFLVFLDCFSGSSTASWGGLFPDFPIPGAHKTGKTRGGAEWMRYWKWLCFPISHCFSISLAHAHVIKHVMCNLQPELNSWYFDKCKFSPDSCFELKYTILS